MKALMSLFLISLFVVSCSDNKILKVHTDYVSELSLASYYVKTPDPQLNRPPIGQKLIVTWTLPSALACSKGLYMDITVRFLCREEVFLRVPVSKRSGCYSYDHLDDAFCKKGRITTYKVDLVDGECVVEAWRHQLWADLIVVEEEPDGQECDIEFLDD